MNDAESAGQAPQQGAHWAIKGLFIISVGIVLVLARTFLMPLMLAILLTLTFSPVRRWCSRRGVPDMVSSGLIVFGLLAICVAAIGGLAGPVTTYAEDAPSIMRNVEVKLRGLTELVDKVSDASAEVDKLAGGNGGGNGDGNAVEGEEAQVSVDTGPSLLTQAAMTVPFMIAQLMLSLVMTFFLIAAGDMLYEKIVAVSPTFSDKRRAIGIAHDIERKISRYFLTITIINAGLGIAVGLALAILGMPNPALFGAMAFVLNFIPYIGAMAGVLISLAIGLVTFDQAGSAVLAAGTYFALTSLEGQFITPYAVGRSLKLNPVAVFLAVAFWGWAWSVVGMVIAVPVLIVIRAFSEKVDSLSGLGMFLSGRGAEKPEEADA